MAFLKKTILFLSFFAATMAVWSQSVVKGKVVDSETNETLMAGTVQVMTTDTTTMVAGGTTAKDGSFNVKNVKDGTYILKISYIGYHSFYRKLSVSRKDNKGTLAVGTVLLVPNTIILNQAVVTAEMKEMEMKDDTLIFNADAFKVPEGSVLEDLIKKLPGVTVEDGVVKVNGKTVRRILVGGKEFFGNDQNMSMKNLPAEIVDKVKTYDRKSDLSRITGIDDGEEETVMDLTIKKGFQQGWFGNIDAGYGNEDLYALRGQLNRFSDKMQGNVIGSQNNTGSNGNATQKQVGGRLVIGAKNFEMGGNIRLNYNNSHSYSASSSQNFVRDNSFSNSRNTNNNRNQNWSGDFRVEWKIDSITTMVFQPRFSFGDSNNSSRNQSATFNADPYEQQDVNDPLTQLDLISNEIKVNTNKSRNWSEGDNYNVSGNLLLNRRLGGKPWFGPGAVTGNSGRNISLRLNGTLSENKNKNFNWSDITYYQRGTSDLVFRLRNNPSDNKNYSIGFTYSEPILRLLFAQINYSYNYSKRHSDGQTYDFGYDDEKGAEVWDYYERFGTLPPDYDDYLSDSLSRYTDNINKTHNLEFSLRYTDQLLNISTGIRIERQNQKMIYQYQGLDTIASRNFSRFSPTLNATLRFSRQHSLRLTYRGNSSQPEMTDLFTLRDNSNQLNIREGNPNLKPSFSHNINLSYNNFFMATRRSINANISFSTTTNSIANRTEYNRDTGGQISRPENINGNWNTSGEVGFNTPLFGMEKFTLNASTRGSYNNRVSYLYQRLNNTGTGTLTPGTGTETSNPDTDTQATAKQEQGITSKNTTHDTNLSERISITWRLNNFDIRANGNVSWNRARNELQPSTGNRDTWSYSYGFSSTGNFPSGFGFSTDFNMRSRRGYSNMNTNEFIWNAQVSYRFLYKKQATIRLEAHDILNRSTNFTRTITADSRTDRETTGVYSYVMAHFVWRFNLWGSRSARRDLREQRSFMNEMPPMPEGGRGGFPGGNRGGGRGGFGGGGFGGGRP